MNYENLLINKNKNLEEKEKEEINKKELLNQNNIHNLLKK